MFVGRGWGLGSSHGEEEASLCVLSVRGKRARQMPHRRDLWILPARNSASANLLLSPMMTPLDSLPSRSRRDVRYSVPFSTSKVTK